MTFDYWNDKKAMIDQKKIDIIYDGETKYKEINLNERYIHKFGSIGINAIIIEILPKDEISKAYFTEPNIDYNKNNLFELKGKEFTIIQFAEGALSYLNGIIGEIDPNNLSFKHDASLRQGSSGSPIFLKGSMKVIGMCIEAGAMLKHNKGCFIWPIYEYLRNFPEDKNITNKNNNLNEQISPVNGGRAISVHFMSNDSNINDSFPSYPEELFSVVVNKLYEKYPEYKNKTLYFLCNGNYLDLNLTMKRNKYNSGDKIIVDVN